MLSLDGGNHAGKAAVTEFWKATVSLPRDPGGPIGQPRTGTSHSSALAPPALSQCARPVHMRVSRVSGLPVDLTDGARAVAVTLTAQWVPEGAPAESAVRFSAVFTLIPGAGGAPPLVKNHLQRSIAAAPVAPNVPGSHAAVADFAGKFFGAFDAASSGDQRASTLGFAFADSAGLSFEDEEHLGKAALLGKLQSLPKSVHKPFTMDVHPITAKSSVAFVTGMITLGASREMCFIEALFIAAAPAGSPSPIIIVGDMFQFNYA